MRTILFHDDTHLWVVYERTAGNRDTVRPRTVGRCRVSRQRNGRRHGGGQLDGRRCGGQVPAADAGSAVSWTAVDAAVVYETAGGVPAADNRSPPPDAVRGPVRKPLLRRPKNPVKPTGRLHTDVDEFSTFLPTAAESSSQKLMKKLSMQLENSGFN